MNALIRFSLKNASVLVLATILVALAGVFASLNLKQELLPDIKFPVVTVITPYPLAGPEIVETQVTKPVESAVAGLANLESYSSTSSANVSVVVLAFNFGVNLRETESAVQQAVARVRGQFPEGVQEPNVSAIRFGDTPVLRLALSSKASVTDLKTRVDKSILPKLNAVAGVSRIDVTGAPKALVRVTLDETKLAKYKLDAGAVAQALRAAGLSFPLGSVQDAGLNVPVKLKSVAQAVADLAGVVVTAQPDADAVAKLGQQARDAQIAAARGQAQALAGVAQLAGQALGQASAARGIAQGAVQVAGQALAKASAADAKADAALKLGARGAQANAPRAPLPGGTLGIPAQPGFPTAPEANAAPNAMPNLAVPGAGFAAPSVPAQAAPMVAPNLGGFGGAGFSGGSGGGAGFGAANFGGSTPSVPLVPVTLAEIAKVELSTEDPKSYTRLNQANAIGLDIYKTQQANTLAVADAIRERIPELEAALGGKVTVLADQGEPIAKGVSSLVKEGLLGGLFAVLVVLVFLRNLRSTFITAVSIPLSLLVGLLVLGTQGFSLNVLTLGGLTIAIGRVIDDSIVVIENIFHKLALGYPPLKAAYEGAKEVSTPVTASTITTVAVFLPLAFVSGIAGEFFRPLALAVTFAILASLIVAFTVIPLLSGLFLRQVPASETKPSAIERLYRPMIVWATEKKFLVLGLAVLALVGALALAPFIPTNFVGGGEATSAEVSLKLRDGTRLARINEVAKSVEAKLEVLRKTGVVASYQTVIGGADNPFAAALGAGTGAQAGFTVLPGKDAAGKKLSIREGLVPRLEEALKGAVKNAELTVVAGQGTGGFAQSLEVQIQAGDNATLRKATDQVLAAVRGVKEVRNPKSNLEAVNTEFVVAVDQKKAYEKGIIPVTVGGAVRAALQGTLAGGITVDDQNLDVLLTVPRGTYATLDQLKKLKLRPVQGGDAVTLESIASVRQEPSPSGIRRILGERTATVTAEPTGNNVGLSTQSLTAAVKALSLPAGATWKIGGVSADQQESFKALGVAILAAVALVYIIMVATFRSLLTPFLLLVSIPLVVVGAFPLLFVTNTPIGLSVFFGFLLLVGIVVTNAIVLIDLVEELQHQGKPLREAIVEGGARRVRPIVMTALTTILALLPGALELFETGGSIVGRPLALTVIGGLTSSTVLTLFVVPALYLAVYGRRKDKSVAARQAKAAQMREAFGD